MIPSHPDSRAVAPYSLPVPCQIPPLRFPGISIIAAAHCNPTALPNAKLNQGSGDVCVCVCVPGPCPAPITHYQAPNDKQPVRICNGHTQ